MTALILEDGNKIGRDPRGMSPDELQAAGHTPKPVLRAIRANCLDCCCGAESEVRKCVMVDCPLWPFRMGTNPWREKREMSDEQRAAAAERLAKAREAKS